MRDGLRPVGRPPVRAPDGEVMAAVDLAVHAGRSSVASVRRDLLQQLLTAVARIEADLRMRGT